MGDFRVAASTASPSFTPPLSTATSSFAPPLRRLSTCPASVLSPDKIRDTGTLSEQIIDLGRKLDWMDEKVDRQLDVIVKKVDRLLTSGSGRWSLASSNYKPSLTSAGVELRGQAHAAIRHGKTKD